MWLALLFLPMGDFSQNCWLLDGEDFVHGDIQISENSLVRNRYGFEEAGCKKAWVKYREQFSIASFAPDQLNLKMEKASYTPLTKEVAEAFNLSSLCGIRDWKAESEREVTGLDCGDYYVPRAGETVYTRLQVKGPRSFAFGMPGGAEDGTSESKRMRDFEPEMFSQP